MKILKPGCLVKYSEYPHYELSNSGIVGLVVSKPYEMQKLPVIDVIWSSDRGLLYPAGTISWEFVEEIEEISF